MIFNPSINKFSVDVSILREDVINVIKGHSTINDLPALNSDSKILDIGGGTNCWGLPYVNHIADFFWRETKSKLEGGSEVKLFHVDVEDYKSFDELHAYCEKNGKFDFIICTHTLEDLNNPKLLCQKMNELGKAGYISIPSKYTELSFFEFWYPTSKSRNKALDIYGKYQIQCSPIRDYKGYCHHRWIYQIKENKLIGFPKQNIFERTSSIELEEIIQSQKHRQSLSEISFWWQDSFDFDFIQAGDLVGNGNTKPLFVDLLSEDDLSDQAKKLFL